MTAAGVGGAPNSIYQSHDSNLSAGSCHSNDAFAQLGPGQMDPSPEKMTHPAPTARTPTERKRKRKNQENTQEGGAVGSTGGGSGSGGKGAKKINDYFKHTPSSPVRPPPNAQNSHQQQQSYYPPTSPGQQHYVGSPGCPPPGAAPPYPAAAAASTAPAISSTAPDFNINPTMKAVNCVQTQTDMSAKDICELESRSSQEMELRESRMEELQRVNDELKRQLQTKQKELEEKTSTINNCLNVVKELLIEKSNIERKEARAKCMQNRLRLGQFVTQRVGASFQENWTDGYAFQDLSKRQEEINNEREEIDRKKKLLVKRKPNDAGNSHRKRAASANNSSNSAAGSGLSNSQQATSTAGSSNVVSSTSTATGTSGNSSATVHLHNGNSNDETLFTKPPPRDGMTVQEYYEAEEILRLRLNSLKKEDADLQLEMEKLERSRNLHIRELKRIHNEDQSRYNNHPMLNDRYLLLVLLGKGGFSEVHKVSHFLT